MTTLAPTNRAGSTAHTARNSIKWLTLAATIALAGCQTVDLGGSGMADKKMVAPACEVAPSDYKVLAYLQKGGDEKKTERITEVLKKKYAKDGVAADANPIVAAQAYVASRADVDPSQISDVVTKACGQ